MKVLTGVFRASHAKFALQALSQRHQLAITTKVNNDFAAWDFKVDGSNNYDPPNAKIIPDKFSRYSCFSVQLSYSTAPAQHSWNVAKPLKECPTLSPTEMIRGFLPGGKFYKKDLNKFVEIVLQEKGDIIYIPGAFGKPPMIMTQNPGDHELVFRYEGVWPQRKGFELLTYHRKVHRKDFFGDLSGLLTSQDKEWSEFRTAVNPILIHPKNVKVYLPTISKVNQEFIARIKEIRDPETLEVPENFKEEINRWTLDSISVVALDQQLGVISGKNPDGKRIFEGLKEFFELSVDLEIKPSLWRQLPNKKFRRIMTLLDELTDLVDSYVHNAMERIESQSVEKPEAEKSVLERLSKLNKKIATVMAMDMLFAGVDTTTTTFTGLLLCLAKNPEKQQKLREELMQILPNKDSPLTVDNMKNLPYLRACLKESLRVYPLSAGNIRTTTTDLVLSGYRVPTGTDVVTIHLGLLKDPSHYSNPAEYTPERWLREPKDKAEQPNACPHATKSSHPFVYLPFGFGPRSCIGRRIAEMELEIGIARVIRNFQVEFNYSTENAFKALQINVPAIPLKFKFTDLKE